MVADMMNDDAHPTWTEEPQDRLTTDSGTRKWVYRKKERGWKKYVVKHRDGVVVRHSLPLHERAE